MENKFNKICPNENCNVIIEYKYIHDMKHSIKKNTVCNSCRYNEINKRDLIILDWLKNTNLTHKLISEELNISTSIIAHVRKKYKLIREIKLSEECILLRSNNFKKNILDKSLNIFGGGDKKSYEKAFKTKFGYEYSIFLSKQSEFKKYYNEVRNITSKNLRKYKHLFNNLDNIGKCGEKGKFQVDHIYSIKNGFINNITPHLIGHPCNLRVISWEENLKKSNNCEITLDELINNTSLFLTKNHKIMINNDF